MVVSCEHGNESSHTIKGRELLDYLNEYQIFKKEAASWR
jgi:hypothetical protein